jgi:putative heme-binding domain-containing protein
LKAPILWAKRAAWHQIIDRRAKELAQKVAKICADASQDETTRIIALWSLEGLKHYDRALMATLLKSDLPDLRREAVRAMGSMPVRPNELATVLKPFVAETHVMVRSQVLRTLADYGKSNPELIDLAVSFCLPDTKSEKLGGDYERKFERYLARMVLEQYPKELDRYLNSPLAAKQPESHLAWAEQALSIDDRTKKFLARWTSIKDQPLSEDDFKAACGLLRNTQVQAALKPIFDAPEADALVALAKKHALDVASPALGKLLQPACERMLESGDASRAMAAAEVADCLNVEGLDALLAEVLSNRLSDASFVTATVNVLARKAQAHPASFKAVLQQDKLGAQASMTALAALASIDPAAAKSFAGPVAGKLSPMAHAALAHRLTESAAGAKLLLDLLDDGNIAKSVVDRDLAERIGAKLKNDKRAKALLQSQHAARAAQVKTFKTKLETFMHVAEQKGGDPAKGKPVFTAICLSCHAVGGQGAGFAPALDGAAHRETEHLLTAILDPDAAVEGNYALYRIFKRDGDAIEGYLEEENARGATLHLMGGGKLFVSREQIASAGFLTGRSVMPRGLIDGFNKQQLADLLAYVRTLK